MLVSGRQGLILEPLISPFTISVAEFSDSWHTGCTILVEAFHRAKLFVGKVVGKGVVRLRMNHDQLVVEKFGSKGHESINSKMHYQSQQLKWLLVKLSKTLFNFFQPFLKMFNKLQSSTTEQHQLRTQFYIRTNKHREWNSMNNVSLWCIFYLILSFSLY